MAAIIPDSRRIRVFRDTKALETWMRAHRDEAPELWIKFHKMGSQKTR